MSRKHLFASPIGKVAYVENSQQWIHQAALFRYMMAWVFCMSICMCRGFSYNQYLYLFRLCFVQNTRQVPCTSLLCLYTTLSMSRMRSGYHAITPKCLRHGFQHRVCFWGTKSSNRAMEEVVCVFKKPVLLQWPAQRIQVQSRSTRTEWFLSRFKDGQLCVLLLLFIWSSEYNIPLLCTRY